MSAERERAKPGHMDPRMLELLACPITHGLLRFDASRNELVSTGARLAYPVRDGIPIMLPSEARRLEEGELGRPAR